MSHHAIQQISRIHLGKCNAQSGAALLMIMLLLILGASSYLLADLNQATYRPTEQQQTAQALQAAKEALLGYAMTYEQVNKGQMPGYLPCPDKDGDGSADTCAGQGLSVVGRLPWRTLGIPVLKDGSGSCLWYAVSGTYKNNPKQALSSNSNGLFELRNALGNDVLGNNVTETDRAIAVVIAPGSALAGQTRAPATDNYCSSTPDIANYLDAYNHNSVTVNNATGSTDATPVWTKHTGEGLWKAAANEVVAFIQAGITRQTTGAKAITFNDTLIAITPQDYEPIYERMNFWVAHQVLYCLSTYTQDQNDDIEANYLAVLGDYINPADGTYRKHFAAQVKRYGQDQCEKRKCNAEHKTCNNACGDDACKMACDAAKTTCYNNCEITDYVDYQENALRIRAGYPSAAKLEISGGAIDYTGDIGERFGRVPDSPDSSGNGDMPDTWGTYRGKQCFNETDDLEDYEWGWWQAWKEQVFYGIDESRSLGGMDGYLVFVGFVAGETHYNDTISVLYPSNHPTKANSWEFLGTPPSNTTTMQLDDAKANILVLVGGRQLTGQTRDILADQIRISNYLEERNIPGSGDADTIPSGDELFYTRATSNTVAFNDLLCKHDNAIKCELP